MSRDDPLKQTPMRALDRDNILHKRSTEWWISDEVAVLQAENEKLRAALDQCRLEKERLWRKLEEKK